MWANDKNRACGYGVKKKKSHKRHKKKREKELPEVGGVIHHLFTTRQMDSVLEGLPLLSFTVQASSEVSPSAVGDLTILPRIPCSSSDMPGTVSGLCLMMSEETTLQVLCSQSLCSLCLDHSPPLHCLSLSSQTIPLLNSLSLTHSVLCVILYIRALTLMLFCLKYSRWGCKRHTENVSL